VNAAFEELRIRARAGSGRLPKLEILRAAIQHIERLQAALRAAAVLETENCKNYMESPVTVARTLCDSRDTKTEKEKPFLNNESASCGVNSLARLRCIVQALAVKDKRP
ncbi:myogenic-determination protein nautilus, partial [Aphomia sociella]